MRASYATPAIVLRARPFGESDRIVSFLTANFGKVTGIAKGAMRSRKRFVNSLEPFALINLSFQDTSPSNLVFILTADLVLGYRHLASSLETISHAAYLVEITEGLIGEREENIAIYQHLKDGLGYLEQHGTSLRFLTSFELKLLRLVGYQPVWENCKRCGDDRLANDADHWHFSLVEGGILCDSCAHARRESLPLSAKAVKILKTLQLEPDELPATVSLPFSVIAEMRLVMLRFIQFHVDREIKSARFLDQFSALPHGVT